MSKDNVDDKDSDLKGVLVQVAHDKEDLLNELCSIIKVLGMHVVGKSRTSVELLKNISMERPNLILTGMHFEDGNAVNSLLAVAEDEPLPAIIIAEKADLKDVEKAMVDHVMAYLVAPVDQHDLRSTCYLVMRRFRQFEELRNENDVLKEALLTRKKLERAKGIMMAKYEITEEDAYLQIRDSATQQRIKIADVADKIIKETTEEL
ncbi:ANTAR domain-containing response regulator [Rubritalea spongiae]|uniref:ANTAR domain-containing response regulator n=1 Tax=Rubritalea spongiae TaxID=430797 RepID=A0ABW5DXZ5_9BACT